VRRLGFRNQRTLARPTGLLGRGFLTGQSVNIRFRPAPPYTGLVFVRTDLSVPHKIPAVAGNVTGTQRRTTLGEPPHTVGMVEHVLAALSGLRVDNCWIEVDAAEPPGLDGSAAPFVYLLHEAGLIPQAAQRPIYTVASPITVSHEAATLAIHPSEADELRVSYILDYGINAPIPKQKHTLTVTPESFSQDLARCRTFVLQSEAEEFQRQGIGRHITHEDILVFGPSGPLNNCARFADEPARHKILDLIGDLALLGCDLRGHVVGYRSGHPLNVALVGKLAQELSEHAGTGLGAAA